MIALFLMPIYLIVSAYVLIHIFKWIGAYFKCLRSTGFRILCMLPLAVIITSPLTAFLIKSGQLHRFLKILSNYWFGIFLYMILVFGVMDIIFLVLRALGLVKKEVFKSKHFIFVSRTVAAALIVLISIYGILHVRNIKTTEYSVEIDKSCALSDTLTVALVADLHLGYSIGPWQVEQMVDKINAADPDLVVMAGDIFDNEYEALKDPERLKALFQTIQSKYGVFACYGNHDLEEPILAGFTFGSKDKQKADPRMAKLLTDSGIRLLDDETICIEDALYIAGRNDPSRAYKTSDSRLSPSELLSGIDKTKPVFVIDHQPKELQELADAGADIDFSGHTHDGQMFPGNLTIRLMWENSCGLIQKDKMTSIVTSGVGIWGPAMRVGTDSEVVIVKVRFLK